MAQDRVQWSVLVNMTMKLQDARSEVFIVTDIQVSLLECQSV
jgi:hypothetical protein